MPEPVTLVRLTEGDKQTLTNASDSTAANAAITQLKKVITDNNKIIRGLLDGAYLDGDTLAKGLEAVETNAKLLQVLPDVDGLTELCTAVEDARSLLTEAAKGL